jgi:hypothetical protein
VSDYVRQIVNALGWLALAFALAVRAYGFTDERRSRVRLKLRLR